jgi:leucyl-tRNA synthetase
MAVGMRERRQLPSEVAQELRKNSTVAERLLWSHIRDNLLGVKFRRQQPIKDTPFVADFCCLTHKLIIELDGAVHNFQIEDDKNRQAELESLGYTVIRFRNEQVLKQLNDVLKSIQTFLDKCT